jgi:hypothetical protein
MVRPLVPSQAVCLVHILLKWLSGPAHAAKSKRRENRSASPTWMSATKKIRKTERIVRRTTACLIEVLGGIMAAFSVLI